VYPKIYTTFRVLKGHAFFYLSFDRLDYKIFRHWIIMPHEMQFVKKWQNEEKIRFCFWGKPKFFNYWRGYTHSASAARVYGKLFLFQNILLHERPTMYLCHTFSILIRAFVTDTVVCFLISIYVLLLFYLISNNQL
jgi:hypothetical protein